MVQALAFAELFAGGILFLCGYKGYTPAQAVKGEAGAPRPIGGGGGTSSSPSSSAAAPAAGSTSPQHSAGGAGGHSAPTPKKAAALTWGSLRRDIKAHKLTPAQVEADLRALNNPPAG